MYKSTVNKVVKKSCFFFTRNKFYVLTLYLNIVKKMMQTVLLRSELKFWIYEKKIEFKLKEISKIEDLKRTNSVKNQSNVRLPKISLSVFSVNLREWLCFKDIFITTIGNNADISGAIELQYLKFLLKGDALRII